MMNSIDLVGRETASTSFNNKNVNRIYQSKPINKNKFLYNLSNHNKSNKLVWNTWRSKIKHNNLNFKNKKFNEFLNNSEDNVSIRDFNKSVSKKCATKDDSLLKSNNHINESTINQSKNPFDLFSIDKKLNEFVQKTNNDDENFQNLDSKLPMCERAFNMNLKIRFKNMRKWFYIGTFTNEKDLYNIQSLEKVSKRRTQLLQNLTKIRYRCITYKQTKCEFQMFALFANKKIDLYKYGTHNHTNKLVKYHFKKSKTSIPLDDSLKNHKSLTQEEILKDLMDQSIPAREVITVNTYNHGNVLKDNNVKFNQNLITDYTNKIPNKSINLYKHNPINHKQSLTEKFESLKSNVKHIAFHHSKSSEDYLKQKLVKIDINNSLSSLTNESTISSMLSSNLKNNLVAANNIVYFDPSKIISKQQEQLDSFMDASSQFVQENEQKDLISNNQFILSDTNKLSDLFQIALEMNIILSLSDNSEIVEYVLKPNSKSVKISRRSLTISENEKGFIKITNFYNGDVCCQEYWKKSDWSQFLWAIRGKCSQLFSSFR